MKENYKAYKGNSTAMNAVNAGEVDAALIYHYYYYGDQAKTGEELQERHAVLLQEPGPRRVRVRLRRRRAQVLEETPRPPRPS